MNTLDPDEIRPEHLAVPGTLNLCIASLQVLLLCGILVATSAVAAWWGVLGLALLYGLVMNSAYAMMHEAEHNLFHPNPRINAAGGVVLALFFPAPYHLMRQGHIGHHQRNRSDDEAFDLYFEGENPLWKHIQYYGILTGVFWMVIVASTVLAAVIPRFFSISMSKLHPRFDRPPEALLETLNPKYTRSIQAEAIAAVALHVTLILTLDIPPLRYGLVLFGFGYTWSALQYLHHFDTPRDVLNGARNVRSFRWMDKVLLNHNRHLIHHQHPTVSWRYLPAIDPNPNEKRPGLLRTYLRMWKGPRFTRERVKNHYAGKVIR
ncbi:MAG: fatty acid desaturase [Kiritimatiellae bacterium]|nr:fatty acid desaturase [Kiritimatiellia bacterium]